MTEGPKHNSRGGKHGLVFFLNSYRTSKTFPPGPGNSTCPWMFTFNICLPSTLTLLWACDIKWYN
jgi:hypothetical protein